MKLQKHQNQSIRCNTGRQRKVRENFCKKTKTRMDTQAPHLYLVEFIVLRCQHSPGFVCFRMTHGIAKSIPRDESAANRTARTSVQEHLCEYSN